MMVLKDEMPKSPVRWQHISKDVSLIFFSCFAKKVNSTLKRFYLFIKSELFTV